jgi:hypothetical protein
MALAACSGGSSPAAPVAGQSGAPLITAPAAAGGSAGGTHEFQGVLTVTGAYKQTLKFTEPLENLQPCNVLAQSGEQGTWSLPSPPETTFSLGINVEPYKGAGTYTDLSAMQNSTWLDADNQEWDPVSATVAKVTVNSDGSGSATFTDLENEYSPGISVSGTETWTCS